MIDRLVNWLHKLMIPFIWGISIFALFLFLYGEIPYLLSFLPIPFTWSFVIGVLLAFGSIPIIFSFIYYVIYQKINPFSSETVFEQSLFWFVCQIIGSIGIFFLSIPVIFLFFSWAWFFQMVFCLGVAGFFYIFWDSYVIKQNGFFQSFPDKPSVTQVSSRGADEAVIIDYGENPFVASNTDIKDVTAYSTKEGGIKKLVDTIFNGIVLMNRNEEINKSKNKKILEETRNDSELQITNSPSQIIKNRNSTDSELLDLIINSPKKDTEEEDFERFV